MFDPTDPPFGSGFPFPDEQPPPAPFDPLALQEPEPEPDPTAPFGPEDPYADYFGRKPRFSVEVGQAIFDKAESWKKMTEGNGVMRQARENFRLYHNAEPDGVTFGERSFSVEGDQNESLRVRFNEFRNLLTHILNMTTNQKVAQQAKAANSEADSILNAQLFDGVLDYFLTQWKRSRAGKQLHKATELCLFTPAGHVLVEWDAAAGRPFVPDEGGSVVTSGDLYVKARSFLDVYFDTNVEDDDELEWVIVRDYMNKYELAERFPDKRDEILHLETKTEGEPTAWGWDDDTDLVPLYKAYWRSSMVLPLGRMVWALSPEVVLRDEDNPYQDDQGQAQIPLLTVRASDGIGTVFGYAPGNDLAPVQMALNMIWSAVMTNEAAFGVGNIAVERGSDIAVQNLAGGLNVIEYAEGKQAPAPFSVSSNEGQSLKAIELVSKQGEKLSGINSVVRGNPDDAMKAASGRALGLIQAMAVQFQSALQASYQQLVNDFGNLLLLIVKRFAQTDQVTAIVGKDRVARMATWSGQTFSNVARVVAENVNPMSKTLAGAREQAEFLVGQGMVTTVDDYYTVATTGQLEPLIEDKLTRNNLIAQENEQMLKGIKPSVGPDGSVTTPDVPILITDPHDLHIAKHLILLDSPIVRRQSPIVQGVLAHIQWHRQMAAQMNAQQTPQSQQGQQSGTQQPQQGGQSQTQQPQKEQQAPGPGGQPVPIPETAQMPQA
jgi:hypothetical protein